MPILERIIHRAHRIDLKALRCAGASSLVKALLYDCP